MQEDAANPAMHSCSEADAGVWRLASPDQAHALMHWQGPLEPNM